MAFFRRFWRADLDAMTTALGGLGVNIYVYMLVTEEIEIREE